MIWLVHFIYSAVGFALCYNYVILNYCIRFAVLPCVKLCLNSCYYYYILEYASSPPHAHNNMDIWMAPGLGSAWLIECLGLSSLYTCIHLYGSFMPTILVAYSTGS